MGPRVRLLWVQTKQGVVSSRNSPFFGTYFRISGPGGKGTVIGSIIPTFLLKECGESHSLSRKVGKLTTRIKHGQ